MSAPLDEKAVDHPRIWLEPAGAPDRCWCSDNQWGDEGVEYVLAASPSPSEMEATIRRLRDYRPPSADPDFGREHHPICDEAADLLSQAQSALAAMRAQLNAALVEVGEQARARGEAEGKLHVSELAGIVEGWQNRAEAAEARIKALEDALRPFANEADQWEGFEDSEALVEGWNGGPASSVNVGSLRSARSALKENAL